MTKTNQTIGTEPTKPTPEEFKLLHQARTEAYLGSMRQYLAEKMNSLTDLAIGVPLLAVGVYSVPELLYRIDHYDKSSIPYTILFDGAITLGLLFCGEHFLESGLSKRGQASQLEKGLESQEEGLRQLRCGLLDRVREIRKEHGAE